MKFIKLIKAGLNREEIEAIDNAVYDVIRNFKKITGVNIYSVFNKPEDGESIFNDDVISETAPKILKYVYDKYDIDNDEFLYYLDNELESLYPY